MQKVLLHAKRRTVIGKQVGALRRQGLLPGVLYGHHISPTPVTMDLREATKVLSGLTGSSLVTIEMDGTENTALVREKQRDYIKGTLRHVDFQVVSLTEKIRAHVSVELTGSSPAVKDYNGVVVTGMDELEVESLPQDLPERFVVDISRLLKIGDGIYVRDLPTNPNYTILDGGDEMLALVTYPAGEEVAETAAAAAGVEEPEVIEKGKKEEEEGEEAAPKK